MSDSTGLSDTLRHMAQNPPSDKVDLGDASPAPDESPSDHAEHGPLALNDDSGGAYGLAAHEEHSPHADGAAMPSAPYIPTRPLRNGHDHGLKAMAIPIFTTVGGLLLVPAVWAVLVLAHVPVWASESDSATLMALVMLACWPISGILLLGAFVFYKQTRPRPKSEPLA
jgi:hypothetical protein